MREARRVARGARDVPRDERELDESERRESQRPLTRETTDERATADERERERESQRGARECEGLVRVLIYGIRTLQRERGEASTERGQTPREVEK